MRYRQRLALLLALILSLAACAPAAGEGAMPPARPEAPAVTSPAPSEEPDPARTAGEIWLYGEIHGEEGVLDEELRLWAEAYAGGARHLFIEYPCYTAEFLNLWMAAADDAILNALYDDWAGTLAHTETVRVFYRSIKAEYPETVFHGTDVGHQYDTTGERYLELLRESGQEDTPRYRLAQTCVIQGRKFYSNGSAAYRESMMTENFIREQQALGDAEIVGFYGAVHIGDGPFSYEEGTVETSMAQRLKEEYGQGLHLLDLSYAAIPVLEPERTDELQVGEKTYEASWFGEVDISSWSDYSARAFWRLEDAYGDFRDAPETGDVLPYTNYPTRVGEGQVFVIDYTWPDGRVERKLYRADGGSWNGMPVTVEIALPE